MELPPNWSRRATQLLQSPRFAHPLPVEASVGHRQYTDGPWIWWRGQEKCEGWGHGGDQSPSQSVLLEAAGSLLLGSPWARLQEISPRELEFFLRDRNSVPALPEEEVRAFTDRWKDLQSSIGEWRLSGVSLTPYVYSQATPFAALSASAKIRELKAFLLSEKLSAFYRRGGRIEVLDVDGTTVYVALDTADIPTNAFLDWLQLSAAQDFREAGLNLVPEAFPSGAPKKTV